MEILLHRRRERGTLFHFMAMRAAKAVWRLSHSEKNSRVGGKFILTYEYNTTRVGWRLTQHEM